MGQEQSLHDRGIGYQGLASEACHRCPFSSFVHTCIHARLDMVCARACVYMRMNVYVYLDARLYAFMYACTHTRDWTISHATRFVFVPVTCPRR